MFIEFALNNISIPAYIYTGHSVDVRRIAV